MIAYGLFSCNIPLIKKAQPYLRLRRRILPNSRSSVDQLSLSMFLAFPRNTR